MPVTKNHPKPWFRSHCLGVIPGFLCLMGLFSFSFSARGAVWLDENFNGLTNGQIPVVSGQLVSVAAASATNIAVVTNGNTLMRLYKSAAATSGNFEFRYTLSDTAYSTPRQQGYISFKIQQVLPNSAGTSYLAFRIGANDTNVLSAAASGFVDMRIYNNTAANNVRIYSPGGATTYAAGTISSNNLVKMEIWYNNTANPFAYNNPNGVASTLNANSFVVYADKLLISSGANGQTLAGQVTNPVTSATIGKFGFVTGSGNATDFLIDDIYAADTAPAGASISSSLTASGQVGYSFTYQISASGMTPTSFSATGLSATGLILDSVTGAISGAPTASGTFSIPISASDGTTTASSTLVLSITAAPSTPPAITSATTASGNVGIPFTYQISASNNPRSFSLSSGTLPAGLSLNTATGLISGTPAAVSPLGGESVTLTSENPAGTGTPHTLTITIGVTPPNIFSGANVSLNTTASWSLASIPGASANAGSFTDLVLNSSATNLTTTSGNIYGKSWNVTNGGNYTVSSVALTTGTSFKLGFNNPNVSPFDNQVSGGMNDFVFLTNGSKLTFLGANPTPLSTEGTVDLKNAGNFNIASNSILEIGAGLTGSSSSSDITKIGGGILILSRSNSFRGKTILTEGTLRVTHPDALSTNGAATYFNGGIFEATTNFDLGRTFTTPTLGTNGLMFDKLDGITTYLWGPVTLKPTDTNTLTIYKIVGSAVGSPYTITKTGTGTLWLRGGTPTGFDIASWRVEQGTLLLGTSSSGALGTNGLTLAGGDVRFSKGIGSAGTYSGQGMDVPLVVAADTTMTLDANPATPTNANTVSFPSLTIGSQTIHVLKSAAASSSLTPGGYTDPSLGFRSATLNGTATFDAGALTTVILQGGSGSGGVTKTGGGRLTLSNLSPQATATATLFGDGVGAITVAGGGSNYSTPPAVTITPAAGDTGTGASATAIVVNGVVTSVTVDNPGAGYTQIPTVTVAAAPPIVNSYTGNTVIQGGTLGLSGTHASSITLQTGAVLEVALPSTNTPTATTTGILTLQAGSAVNIVGTPAAGTSYTLVTASSISGTPVLSPAITGFSLVKSGNSLVLQPAAVAVGFDAWITNYPSLTGANAARSADPDGDGMKNSDECAFGTDPASTGSRSLTAVDTGTSGQVTLKWLQRSDVTYSVKSTTDLSAGFTNSESGAAPSSPQPISVPSGYVQHQITVSTSGPKKFIRVEAVVP